MIEEFSPSARKGEALEEAAASCRVRELPS
jgi:hypothetical protein